ncbi:MAG: zinc-dependent metalloprotease, partial [Bacteroidota bacterium]
KADGSNCETAADGFCDTAPDYISQGGWDCNSNVEYQDSLLDPDSTRLAVPGTNFMSYADDRCASTFTPEQLTAMQTNLTFRNDLREDNSGDGAIAALGEDLNLIFPEDGARTEWSNYVELEWSSVPNADFYLVQLNVNRNFGGSVFRSFFTKDTTAIIDEGLVANRRYYWRVRPINAYLTSSEFGEEIWDFRTGRNAVSSIDPTLDAAITLAPNPVYGGQDLRITGRDLGIGGKLTYELIDPAGRILLSRENISVAAATGFSERIETTELPAGVYFLRLRLDDKLVTRRVMVTP